MRRLLPLFIAFCVFSGIKAQGGKIAWCGYALIEGVPNIEFRLPMLSLITPDPESARSNLQPNELLQVKISLDGSKAIVEGCWKIFPTRDVMLNLLLLSANDREKESVDQAMTYTLFGIDGSREDGAAQVREYLQKNIREWELPEDESGEVISK